MAQFQTSNSRVAARERMAAFINSEFAFERPKCQRNRSSHARRSAALSLLFGRLATFAGFEGRCVTWSGFVVTATLIGFTR